MFTHIMVGANDIDASKKFYDATMTALGYPAPFVDDRGRVFYRSKTGTFALTKPINGEPACGANGGTIGFAITSPEQGDAWHAAGLANGGTACEDAPGIREGGMGSMYLAYLRDPSGNKICVLLRMPS